jgi:hypothetical protein
MHTYFGPILGYGDLSEAIGKLLDSTEDSVEAWLSAIIERRGRGIGAGKATA